jgi:MFS family permease
MSLRKLGSTRVFWVFIAMMLCAGAAELCVSQWASVFAEQGLGVSKTLGDLLGPCFFAAAMGCSRVFYARRGAAKPLRRYMIASGALAVTAYLIIVFAPWPLLSLLGCGLCGVAVGIFWPGTFSSAAKALPGGGTSMFAFLALAGDLGCFLGPSAVGFITGAAGDNLKIGIFAGIVFPVAFTAILLSTRAIRGRERPADAARD